MISVYELVLMLLQVQLQFFSRFWVVDLQDSCLRMVRTPSGRIPA